MKHIFYLFPLIVFICSCQTNPDPALKAKQIYSEMDALVKKSDKIFTDFYTANKDSLKTMRYKESLESLGNSLNSFYDTLNLGYQDKVGIRNYSREDQAKLVVLIKSAQQYVYKLKTLFKVNYETVSDDQLTLDNYCKYLANAHVSLMMAKNYKNQKDKQDVYQNAAIAARDNAHGIGTKLEEYKSNLDAEWQKARKDYISVFPDVKFE